MTQEERLQKMRDGKKRHLIGEKEFDFKNEHYELLYQFPDRNNLCVYRRSYANSGGMIAIEVVCEDKGKNEYPTDDEFGKRGWCFTSNENRALELIKEKFKLPI